MKRQSIVLENKSKEIKEIVDNRAANYNCHLQLQCLSLSRYKVHPSITAPSGAAEDGNRTLGVMNLEGKRRVRRGGEHNPEIWECTEETRNKKSIFALSGDSRQALGVAWTIDRRPMNRY